MFLNYRVYKLKVDIARQAQEVDDLLSAARAYGQSYYTDRHVDANKKLAGMRVKLLVLESKVNKQPA